MLWTAGLCSQFNAYASDDVAVQPIQRERIDRLGRHNADLGTPRGYGKQFGNYGRQVGSPNCFL